MKKKRVHPYSTVYIIQHHHNLCVCMSKEEVICSLRYFNIIQKLNKKWSKKGQFNRQQEAQLSMYCLPGYLCIVAIGFNYSYEEVFYY